jgi:DNA-binding SARP family transcriptional activator
MDDGVMVRDAGAGVGSCATGVMVRVLGGFTATVGDDPVSLGGPRQRGVLARVLIGGAEAASAEQVLNDVWGERADEATVGAVHAYVSRLRRLFGSPQALPRRGPGYVLDRDVVAVDADLFTADFDAGRRALARGNDEDAAALLEAALARWTGPSAFGVGGQGQMPFLAPVAARLEELRVLATEALADAHARQGRAADDVAVLEDLATRDPLRESVAVQLVRALYAAGRQADALAAYDRCRSALADELGVEPTPALRQMRAAVLAHQPLPGVAGTVLPTHLPPRNRSFVGRRGLLAAVDATLDDDTRRPRAVALTGLGGVGKTELALELAHLRHRHGRVAWWISAEDPAGTATGLAALAAALGIAPFERREDARAALWAQLDRTPGWLLVYDNADEPAQLEPFLPAARHGDVIITSRNPAWRRIAHPVAIGPLARGESLAYVATRTGDRPVEADTLAELLGDLPLALEQACAYIEQTRMSLPDYVDLFRRHRDGLLLRDVEGSGRTVATTWGLAFDRLAARAPRAAELLETIAFLAPDAISVATLGRFQPGELELQDALRELLRLSLIDREAETVRVHRLVQDVVRARMTDTARRDRLVAVTRACVAQSVDWVEHGRDVPDDQAAHLVSLAGHGESLGTEPDGLVETLERVAGRQAERALYPAAEHVLRAALRLHAAGAARDDSAVRGRLTCALGQVLDTAGRLAPALELHREAVALLEATDRPGDAVLAHAYNRLGHVLNCADDAAAAIVAHRQALDVLHRAGRTDLEPEVLIDLGYTLWSTGALDAAGEAFRTGRAMLEEQDRSDERGWAHATGGLGMVEQDAGRLDAAVAHHRAAIAAFTQVGGADHPDTAQAFDKLGYALRLQGDVEGALDAHRRGVGLLERVLGPDDSRVAMALTNLGLALADAGTPEKAVEVQTRAREIFRRTLGPAHFSTRLAGERLADALAAAGRPARAQAVRTEVGGGAAEGTNDPEPSRPS